MIKRLLISLSLVYVLLLLAPSQQQAVEAAPAQQTNLLNNPSFEQPYANGAAQGWGRWHQDTGGATECEGTWAGEPVWSPEGNGALIFDGGTSQHVGNQFNKFHAGVAQDVSVTPGSTYRFSFWARGRAANEQYPAPSYGFINLNVQARIDPTGSGAWNNGNIIRGGVGQPHDQWLQFSVEATATSDKITVFAAADLSTSGCAGHMDIWFDKAEVVEVGPPPTNTPPPPPPPPPAPVNTNTPVPPTVTPTPENTATPVNTATPTATATPEGGMICLNAFSDVNGNGIHDPNEGFMAGVSFTVARDGAVVSTGVSRGTNSAICFEGLPAGNYEVVQSVPPSLEMTTAPNAVIPVENGKTIGVEFGSRIRDASATTDDSGAAEEVASNETSVEPTAVTTSDDGNATAGDDEGGTDPLALVGLGIILLAILLLVGLIVMLMRQQRAN